jgi:glyoxylase I family protein
MPPGSAGVSRPPFALAGIDHIVLRVAALPRMLAFYCGVLGCRVEREQPELGLTQLRAGASLIDLVTRDGPLGRRGPGGSGRNLDHFCLTLAPFEEGVLTAWLATQGVRVHDAGERYGAGGEGRSLYVEDPEGNSIELKGSNSGG